MKIKTLLKLHSKEHHSAADPRILGDAFLLNHNFLYRNIRIKARRNGYRLVDAWPTYHAIPLCELGTILASKKIPIIGSFQILAELESKHPGKFELADLPEPIQSYHFHEAAHTVAAEVFSNRKTRSKKERILQVMMGESYANTVESMAILAAETKVHRQYLRSNSFMDFDQEQIDLRQTVLRALGLGSMFKLVFLSFLYANFLYESVSRRSILEIVDRTIGKGKLSSVQKNACVALFNDGVNLSLAFRIKSSQFHMSLLGFTGNIFDLVDFDFEALIQDNIKFQSAIEELRELACEGHNL